MMQIRRDWGIEFDAGDYLSQVGGTLPKLLSRPPIREDWEAALADAACLVRPAAVWASFGVKEFRHERVVLSDGTKIGGGPVTTVVAGASELVLGVCTAGPEISERITEYQRRGQRVRAMFLDDLGSWAVDQVRQQLCRTIEAQANERGWRASASLSPGESEWSVKEQSVIFSLLNTAPIGVTLTESLVMIPIKSLSLLVGAGPGPLGIEGASNCDFCTIRERCTHRHARAAV